MENTLERTIAWLRTRGVLFGEWKGDVKEQEQSVWNRYLRQLPTRFRNLRFGFIDELLQFYSIFYFTINDCIQTVTKTVQEDGKSSIKHVECIDGSPMFSFSSKCRQFLSCHKAVEKKI